VPNALQITDPDASDNPLAQAPSWADAAQSVAGTVSSGVSALDQWLAAQRAKSAQMGLWNDQTGLPTGKGLVSAAGQYSNALMMGTTAPGDAPGFSLEKVQRRPLAPPNEHIWKIKDPAGADAGTIDTTWNPDIGNLHIEDFQSVGGPNTLGQAAIRQLRSALLEQYPEAQSLSGLRISGATYADRNSGAGPGRYASQLTARGEPAPIEVSGGPLRGQSNIVRFGEDADAIHSTLPPVPEGHTRLWRGNRPDEVGTNQQFTSDLPGIALPFREAYGGPVSYVDVPSGSVGQYLQTDFAAPGVEYWLPPNLASQAKPVHVAPRAQPGARKSQ
jgi:hypothetical protein